MRRWQVFPAFLVRVAGFSFERLAPLKCSRAADQALDLCARIERRAELAAALDSALLVQRYDDLELDEAGRKGFKRHTRQAFAFCREPSATFPTDAFAEIARVIPPLGSLIGELRVAQDAWQVATVAYERALAEELPRARAALRALYRDDPRLQEAAFLESPSAYIGIRSMLQSDAVNSKQRQRERVAVMYAQRFFAKNDTNSICGPVGVARVPDVTGSGPATISIVREDVRRQTYFSHWGAAALLEEAVRRAGAGVTTLRMQPSARVEGDVVSWCVMHHDATTTFRRRYASATLPAPARALLTALAAPRLHDDVVALAMQHDLDRDDALALVDELVEHGLLLRGPTIEPGLFDPLGALRAEVATWPGSDARRWALAEIDACATLASEFGRAPLAQRIEILERLNTRFASATGAEAERNRGGHYADRALLHEDCFVEVSAELGSTRRALETTVPLVVSVLELPNELARERVREWFRGRFGEGVRVPALACHRAYDEDRPLETAASTPRATELREAMERVRGLLARTFASALDVVRITSDELRAAVGPIAEPTHPAYVSADIMIRSLPGGASELVVGEVHGFFWLSTSLLDIVPDAERDSIVSLMRRTVQHMAGGHPTMECLFLHTQAADRRYPIADGDLELMAATQRAGSATLGELDMQLDGDRISFFRGAAEVVPIVAYTNYPFIQYTTKVAPLFDDFAERYFPDSLMPTEVRSRGDLPRLVIDDVVFLRRTWRRSLRDLRRPSPTTPEQEFRWAQALRAELGCGEHIFVSVPGEPKPVMVDLASPLLVDALVALLSGHSDDAVLTISEMMPAASELCANGADGVRTSELRMGFSRLPGD